MWLCLIHPQTRAYYTDPERVAREGTAYLRAAWAAHPEDRVVNGFITQCIAHNEQFARSWARHDVKINGRGLKGMRHLDAGEIAVDFEVLMLLQDSDQRLMILRGADDDSQAAMDWPHTPSRADGLVVREHEAGGSCPLFGRDGVPSRETASSSTPVAAALRHATNRSGHLYLVEAEVILDLGHLRLRVLVCPGQVWRVRQRPI